MQKTNEELLAAIYADLQEIKKQLSNQQQTEHLSGLWLKRQQVMELLEYGDTQMAAIDKKGILEIAKVGKRKFYKKASVLKLIESSMI